MRIKIFSIPLIGGEALEQELNSFLARHAIADVEQQLVQSPSGAYWSFCVRYILGSRGEQGAKEAARGKKKKIDYREVLDAATFQRFTHLRKLRKQWAIEDSVSTYIVFTDAELAEIVQLENPSKASLKSISGIGDKKVAAYGDKVLTALTQLEQDEASQ